jgi:hypothetical protein
MRRRAGSRASLPAQKIELFIDELVLDGFSPSARYAIGDALTAELEALLQQQGLSFPMPAFTGEPDTDPGLILDGLDAGSIPLKGDAPAGSVGRQVARAVDGILRNVEKTGNDLNRSSRSLPAVAPTRVAK